MIAKWISTIFFASMVCAAHAQCSTGTEFLAQLCPSPLPPIRALIIEESANSQAQACAGFHLNQAQAMRYFKQAKWIKDEGRAKLEWLACATRGKLFFNDGKSAQWSISPAQTAVVLMEDGGRFALYCVRCQFGLK